MDSVEYDEFGRVYIRPTYRAPAGGGGAGVAPKVNLEVRFCVICSKKLSMYNTDKNKVCHSDKCEREFLDRKKKKK
jgi:predicted nucleic acid-binding Zn ribbon protein